VIFKVETPYPPEILFDPQTSGGLLISVPEDRHKALLVALEARGVQTTAVIGRIDEGAPGVIEIV